MTVTAIQSAPSARKRRKPTKAQIAELDRRLAAASRIQAQIQQLETQLLEHRQWLLQHLLDTEKASVNLGNFFAYRRTRHNWTYTAEVQRDMLALRNAQQWEQRQGLAVDQPTPYVALVFKGE